MRVVETLPSSTAHLLGAAAVSGEPRQMNGGRTSATTAALRRPDTARGAAGGHQGRGGGGAGTLGSHSTSRKRSVINQTSDSEHLRT